MAEFSPPAGTAPRAAEGEGFGVLVEEGGGAVPLQGIIIIIGINVIIVYFIQGIYVYKNPYYT